MATEVQIWDITLVAAADLSAKQFHFVKLSGNSGMDICSAVTDMPVGILQDKPASGKAGAVRLLGVSKVEAGGALVAGNPVGTDANGAGVAKVIGTNTTHYVAGECKVGCNSGERGEVILRGTPFRAA